MPGKGLKEVNNMNKRSAFLIAAIAAVIILILNSDVAEARGRHERSRQKDAVITGALSGALIGALADGDRNEILGLAAAGGLVGYLAEDTPRRRYADEGYYGRDRYYRSHVPREYSYSFGPPPVVYQDSYPRYESSYGRHYWHRRHWR